jgi:DNA-binding NtrC family response regulator
MAGTYWALAAEDDAFGTALQTYLRQHLDQAPSLTSYQGLREHLGRDGEGILLLATASPADCEQAGRLVREISLLQCPLRIVLIHADAAGPGTAGNGTGAALPADLNRLLLRRLNWPSDGPHLVSLLRERLGRGRCLLTPREGSLPEIISRRLLHQTPSLIPLVERIALAAAHDVTVLLTGETGTGKTFLARLMHDCSPRRHHPFLVVPCGAQPANLVESAFFGHVKGAFTGADRAKIGKFAAAGEGTLLLDEIDTLGLEQQAGLLRVIETGEYEPVGSNETLTSQARIIVASNWDLQEAADHGKFRLDLYYRLNVMSFHLPPLRERVEDIAPLVRSLTARFNTKFRKDLTEISLQALAALESFHWPGNIRQLENVIQQAVLVSSGPSMLFEHLPQPVREFLPTGNGEALPRGETLLHNRELLERSVIQRALTNNGFSRARAAHALGISRVTLYKKMKKYGLMSAPMRVSRA